MKQFLIIALVAAMLLLFGCNGQANAGANAQANAGANAQQPSQNSQPSANGQQAPAGSEQQPAGTQAGAEANAGANMQAQGSASDQLAAFFGMRGTIQYKVAYDIVTMTNGQQSSMQATEYIKGIGMMRMDSTYNGMESRTYLVDKTVVSCSQQQGAWSCLKLTSKNDQATQATDDIQSNISAYTVTADGSMQVAGTTATCFKVAGKDIQNYRYCVSSDGVPLYIKVEGTSQGYAYSSEMTATSYSKDVSDSDFTPPATPTDLPAIPSGIGAGGSGSANASGSVDVCSYCGYLTGADKDSCLSSCSSG